MKKLFVFLFFTSAAFAANSVQAQSFTVASDTIFYTATPSLEWIFDTTVTGASPLAYSWTIISTDFPADWIPATAFCDRILCYSLINLYPSTIARTTTDYPAGDTAVLDLVLNLGSAATPGCYYITAMLHNNALYSDSATETWYVCYSQPPGTTTSLNQTTVRGLNLYPNPVFEKLTVDYVEHAGSVELFDLPGRLVASQKLTNGHTDIFTEGLAPGVYIARIKNDEGTVTDTRKIIKH